MDIPARLCQTFGCTQTGRQKKIIHRNDIAVKAHGPLKPFTVIEGSYCMRPEFRGLYDYSVFLSCSYEQQINRIRSRNGEEMLKNFIEKWIPMENTYFDAFQVKENCNVTIQT